MSKQFTNRYRIIHVTCNYKTALKYNLKQHVTLKHNNNHTLRRHIKVIHNKIHDHTCDLCDYASSQKSRLQDHIEKHHTESSYRATKKSKKCQLCEFTTATEEDLTDHLMSNHVVSK